MAANAPQQRQIGRAREQEAPRPAVAIDGPLDRDHQLGRSLRFVDGEGLVAFDEGLGVEPRRLELREVVESMMARRPSTTEAPAIAPAAAAVTPATKAYTRSLFDQRRTLGAKAMTTTYGGRNTPAAETSAQPAQPPGSSREACREPSPRRRGRPGRSARWMAR